MAKDKTETREEWLAARLELLEGEKELTRCQELPWVRVDNNYRFDT